MITCPCCQHSFEPEATAAGLTPRQSELLDYLRAYTADFGGISPTYDEMKDFLGVASKTTIHHLVGALVQRGAIRRVPGRHRAISIVGGAS